MLEQRHRFGMLGRLHGFGHEHVKGDNSDESLPPVYNRLFHRGPYRLRRHGHFRYKGACDRIDLRFRNAIGGRRD